MAVEEQPGGRRPLGPRDDVDEAADARRGRRAARGRRTASRRSRRCPRAPRRLRSGRRRSGSPCRGRAAGCRRGSARAAPRPAAGGCPTASSAGRASGRGRRPSGPRPSRPRRRRCAGRSPYFFLSRSASVIGARRTTARSLVKWSPPIGITAVWAIVPLLVDGDLGRPAADVDEADAELLLVRRQHGLGRGELLEDELHDLDARLVHAGHDVLGHGDGRRDDVDVGLEPAPDHPERVGDPVLAVDGEVPGHDVHNLMILRDLHAPGGVDDAGDVLLGDLPVLARRRRRPRGC